MFGVWLFFLAPLALSATLNGSQVTFTYDFPTVGSPVTVPNTQTVGPGVEYPVGSVVTPPFFNFFQQVINLQSSSILINQFNVNGTVTATAATFNGYIFAFRGAPAITRVVLDPASTFTAAQAPISFAANQIDLNVQGLPFTSSTSMLLDITLSPIPIPEPQSIAFAILGLVGIGAVIKTKSQA